MKNLNEQLNRINQLFNYKVGNLINEQEEISNSEGISYLIMAGASNIPMRAETLHKEQGFPLPKGSTSKDVFLYEIKLSDALNDDFSKAIVLNRVDEKNRDQIIFEQDSTINKGLIRIPINQKTINQNIKVSGNGALVLSRGVNEYKNFKKMGGLMLLELSSKELYSNNFSIEKLGINERDLIAKINGTLNGIIYALNDDEGKSNLDPRLTEYQEYPNKYWITIKDLDGKQVSSGVNWIDKLSLFKNTINQNNFKIKYKTVSKVVKKDIITPGLNQLPDLVTNIISTNLPEVPKDIINKLILSLNKIISIVNNKIDENYIYNYFETYSYTKSKTTPVRLIPKPEIKKSDNKYKEGKG